MEQQLFIPPGLQIIQAFLWSSCYRGSWSGAIYYMLGPNDFQGFASSNRQKKKKRRELSAPWSADVPTRMSKNHRMAWVEKDHSVHLIPTPCYVLDHQPPDQAAQSRIQPGISYATAVELLEMDAPPWERQKSLEKQIITKHQFSNQRLGSAWWLSQCTVSLAMSKQCATGSLLWKRARRSPAISSFNRRTQWTCKAALPTTSPGLAQHSGPA